MVRRKVRDAEEAAVLLAEAERSGRPRAEFARSNGIDARSLNMWRVCLARRRSPAELRLVELVALGAHQNWAEAAHQNWAMGPSRSRPTSTTSTCGGSSRRSPRAERPATEVGLHHGILEVHHWNGTVVFQYEATKHGGAVKSKLAKFGGTLLVDAESRHDQVFGETITEAGCNAHGRRKFRDAETVQPLLAEEGGRFVSSWFDLEEESQDAGLAGADLRRWRQERIGPLVDAFRVWISAVKPALILGTHRDKYGLSAADLTPAAYLRAQSAS
jgi:hypothetical protein